MQQLTQPPNPHQLNSILIHHMFLACLLCARARNGWRQWISRCLVLRKQSWEIWSHAPLSPPLPPISLGLEILIPSQAGISLPSNFWKKSSLPSSLSQQVAYTQQFQPGGESFFSLSLQEIFQLWSRYKNLAFEV